MRDQNRTEMMNAEPEAWFWRFCARGASHVGTYRQARRIEPELPRPRARRPRPGRPRDRPLQSDHPSQPVRRIWPIPGAAGRRGAAAAVLFARQRDRQTLAPRVRSHIAACAGSMRWAMVGGHRWCSIWSTTRKARRLPRAGKLKKIQTHLALYFGIVQPPTPDHMPISASAAPWSQGHARGLQKLLRDALREENLDT